MALAASNIVLTGGNTRLHNFKSRFEKELRSFVPADIPMHVSQPTDPDLYAWKGAYRFADDENRRGLLLNKHMVSREQYLENGNYYCNKKFASI